MKILDPRNTFTSADISRECDMSLCKKVTKSCQFQEDKEMKTLSLPEVI